VDVVEGADGEAAPPSVDTAGAAAPPDPPLKSVAYQPLPLS
jgi:hypothetical protein